MALSVKKRQQLSAFLGSLPTQVAIKLFAALEADRMRGGAGLPHGALLDDLRRRLLSDGATLPKRSGDAKRRFFALFEDFFVADRSGRKRAGIIPRSSLEKIWGVLTDNPALVDTVSALGRLDQALQNDGDIASAERAMFAAAAADFARLCDSTVSDKRARERLVAALGDEAVLADFKEMRQLLTGADFLQQLKAIAPVGTNVLSEDELYQLRTLFVRAHDQSSEIAALILLALKGRLDKPWNALALYYHFEKSADEKLAAAKEAASALPEALFEDLEMLARALERDGGQVESFDPQAARLRVTYFADFSDGLATQAKKIGDNVVLNRVEACREVAAEAFERFCELALANLRHALPVHQSGGSSLLRTQRPDYANSLSIARIEQGRDAAALIAEAPKMAARLGAGAEIATAITDDAQKKIRGYFNDLVTEIRAAEGEDQKAAHQHLDKILNVADPLLNREEAGLIRDRAAAAAVAV